MQNNKIPRHVRVNNLVAAALQAPITTVSANGFTLKTNWDDYTVRVIDDSNQKMVAFSKIELEDSLLEFVGDYLV